MMKWKNEQLNTSKYKSSKIISMKLFEHVYKKGQNLFINSSLVGSVRNMDMASKKWMGQEHACCASLQRVHLQATGDKVRGMSQPLHTLSQSCDLEDNNNNYLLEEMETQFKEIANHNPAVNLYTSSEIHVAVLYFY